MSAFIPDRIAGEIMDRGFRMADGSNLQVVIESTLKVKAIRVHREEKQKDSSYITALRLYRVIKL